MKMRRALLWIICLLTLGIAGVFLALSRIPSGERRVTTIDSGTLFANYDRSLDLFDVLYKGRKLWVDWHLQPTKSQAISTLRNMSYDVGQPPSHTIGEEAFFTRGMAGPRIQLVFRRFNLVVKVARQDHVVHAPSPEIDQEEIEHIGSVIDAAILSGKSGIEVREVSRAEAFWDRVGSAQFVIEFGTYIACAAYVTPIAIIPIILLWLLLSLVRSWYARTSLRCAILALGFAPGAVVGHGFYFGPVWPVFFANVGAALQSIMVTWIVFTAIAFGVHYFLRWLRNGAEKRQLQDASSG